MGPIRAYVLVLLTIVLAACASRHGVSAGPRIAVGAEELAETGPFRIVYAGPKGEVAEPREITLAFSRPARPARPATVARAHDGASVEGAWHWFHDRTAVFLPKDYFHLATRVVAEALDVGCGSAGRKPCDDGRGAAKRKCAGHLPGRGGRSRHRQDRVPRRRSRRPP